MCLSNTSFPFLSFQVMHYECDLLSLLCYFWNPGNLIKHLVKGTRPLFLETRIPWHMGHSIEEIPIFGLKGLYFTPNLLDLYIEYLHPSYFLTS